MLWDSIPVNDPFGGWVYWTRIPPEKIEEVDVVRGGSSSTPSFRTGRWTGTLSQDERSACSFEPIARSETPCVVGFATTLEVRRNKVNPGHAPGDGRPD